MIDAKAGRRRYVAHCVNELLSERGEAVTQEEINAAVSQAVIRHTWAVMVTAGEVHIEQDGLPVWISPDVECEIMDAEELDAAILEAVDAWPDARLH